MQKNIHVEILSLNTCLSICPPFRMNGAPTRADKIAESIYSHINPKTLDIICLQELVVSRSKTIQKFIHHPYVTNVVTGSWHSNNIRFIQSGLTTLSKWPIIEQAHHIFHGQSYHMEAYMAKAVQYSKILVHNRLHVHVLNTHTQAWTNQKAQNIRLSQFRQTADFLKRLDINPEEPVVLCGDFNFDFYEHADVLNKFSSILKMNMHLPFEPQFSFDPTINKLVGTDDADEYKTRSFEKGCYNEFVRDGLCICCPKQLIDGIASSNMHLIPKNAHVAVINNSLKKSFEIYINMSTIREISQVSDHFPVLAQFDFEYLDTTNHVCRIRKKKISLLENIAIEWVIIEIVLFVIFYSILVGVLYNSFKRSSPPKKPNH